MEHVVSALVARSMTRSEVVQNNKAVEAVQKEWQKLRDKEYTEVVDGKVIKKKGVWDESAVEEFRDLTARMNDQQIEVFIGRVFDLCVEKGYELPIGHEDRKLKGREVFGGNDVWTQNRDIAIFQELASQPATLEASCAADAYGCIEGHTIEQADAEQAYVQAVMKGTPTYVRLPKHQWPASWEGMHDPVVPLKLALYGHPESGVYWEQKAHEELTKRGFQEVEDWKSCYWDPKLKVFLVLYVDDFKLAGPAESMEPAWKKIREAIVTGDPHPLSHFLGCTHEAITLTPQGSDKVVNG